MIEFIWHAFMDRTINSNVNDISYFKGCKGLRYSDGPFLFEAFLEFIPGFSPISVTMSHFTPLKIL